MVGMAMRRAILACLCLSIVVRHAQCGTVLSVLMPGPLSHLFNMKKIAEAVAARGHTVKVSSFATASSLPFRKELIW